MHPAPIRHTLKIYTPEEIAELNAKLGRHGPTAFRPAEELLEDIAAGKSPDATTESTWYYHPDERVQLAMLQREDLAPIRDVHSHLNSKIIAIWTTAYLRAAHERVVWTPVLDYIAARRGYWPLDAQADGTFTNPSIRDLLPFPIERPVKYRSIAEQARLLVMWISHADEERLAYLLRAQSDEFVGSALACVRSVTPERFREILDQRPSLAPVIAASRERMSEQLRTTLKEWAFDDLHRIDQRLATLPPNAGREEKWSLAYGTAMLHSFVEHGRRLPNVNPQITDADIERLFALLDAGGDPHVGPARAAAIVLLACAGRLNETRLLALLQHLERDSLDVRTLVDNAVHATPAFWTTCLKHSPIALVQEAISWIPEARQSPDVRALLSRSNHVRVLVTLLDEATDTEFVGLFRKILRRDLNAASEALSSHPERARLLNRRDLLPLFESSDTRHRLQAITLADVVQPDPVPLRVQHRDR